MKPAQKPPAPSQAHSSKAIITNKQWLASNWEPWNVVTAKWKESIPQRKSDIASLKFNGLIEAWPILRHQFGYNLIEIDFAHDYPDKAMKLINDWDNYSTKIIVTAISKSKRANNDAYSSELTSKSKYAVQEDDIKNLENLKALNALNYILPGSFERQEGIEKIIGHLDIGDSIQNKIDMETPFPIIYVSRDLRDIPNRFYLVYKNIVYSFDNFLPALDMLMKMVLILDIPYPSEAETILTFLQLFFYEIVSEKRKNSNSSIYTVVYDLNAEKIKFF